MHLHTLPKGLDLSGEGAGTHTAARWPTASRGLGQRKACLPPQTTVEGDAHPRPQTDGERLPRAPPDQGTTGAFKSLLSRPPEPQPAGTGAWRHPRDLFPRFTQLRLWKLGSWWKLSLPETSLSRHNLAIPTLLHLPSLRALLLTPRPPSSRRAPASPAILPALHSHQLRSPPAAGNTCSARLRPPRARLAGPAHPGPTRSPSRPAPRADPSHSRPCTPPGLPGCTHRRDSSQAPELAPA